MGIRNTTGNIFKAAITGVLVTGVVTFLGTAIVDHRFASVKLDREKMSIEPKPTRIFDASGNKMAEFEKDRKEMTPYSEIPKEIVEGAVATEDREFFNHSGVNVRTIFRALLVNIKSGSFAQGGSTITQQLVKRVYLNPGKTLDRKLQEAVYSTAVEKEYSKQEIMALYLNHIFYGERAYGIKNAIKTYFGQTLEEFDKQDRIDKIAKSALLVGIPNAPSLFDPYLQPENSMKRRNTVLTNMYVEGYITQAEYEAAKKKDFLVLKRANLDTGNEKIRYPEYVSYVLSEAGKSLEMPVEEVMYSGLTIYTSFEPEVYKAMRKHMEDGSLYPSNASDGKKVEGAAVLVNPQNGEIYALTGAREKVDSFLSFNRAFQAKRQPGSAFKPLIAYGPALETGRYSPYSTVPCNASFPNYSVRDHSCWGAKSMAEALRVSNNVPAVWMLQKVGIDYARSYVERLGIKLSPNDKYLPIALGGIDNGVTPLELADAFQAYANGGKRAEAHTVRRIVNTVDEVIYEPSLPKQVIKEKGANQMKSMLKSVVTSGTGRNAYVPGYSISGKTGTNELPGGGGNKDIWFVGFTDNLVGVVWMGFDQSDRRHFIATGQTSYISATMFQKIAKDTLNILPKVKVKEKELEKISINLYHNTEGNEVSIEWKDQPGIKYEVYRDGLMIGDSLDGKHKDPDAAPGKKHNYKVYGFDEESGEKVIESNEATIELPKIEVKKPEEEKSENENTQQEESNTEKVTSEGNETEQSQTTKNEDKKPENKPVPEEDSKVNQTVENKVEQNPEQPAEINQ
ncbi:transglycosylase domain-containing protein [Bacillus toyonensis]|uniref:transglycosylase domain-containing protein n=1 Tax=Bacillus toyonensis TaxID=155322 RepID=UPI002E1A85CC|nr:transglycosylase domain-containing protein [Bacillus toyonensis]